MEKCKYCGIEYHPMPRWTKPGELTYVCNMVITRKDDGEIDIQHGSPCEDKAIADGYKKRLDLTPRR